MPSLGYAEALRRGSPQNSERTKKAQKQVPQVPAPEKTQPPRNNKNPWKSASGLPPSSAWGSINTSASKRIKSEQGEPMAPERMNHRIAPKQASPWARNPLNTNTVGSATVSPSPKVSSRKPINGPLAVAPAKKLNEKREQKKGDVDFRSSNDFPALSPAAPVVAASPAVKRKQPQPQHDSSRAKKTPPQKKKKASSQSSTFSKEPVSKKASLPKKKVALKQEQSLSDHHSSNMLTFPNKILSPPSQDQRQGGGTELLSLVQKQGGALSSGRQRLHPRKKIFTSLKKKVLQERLEIWKKQQEQAEQEKNKSVSIEEGNASNEMSLDSSPACCHAVSLNRFCTFEEIQDEDEHAELLDNLTSMAAKIGSTTDIFVEAVGHDAVAFVVFENIPDAQAAKACWDGFVLGGERLRTTILNVSLQSTETDLAATSWRPALLHAYQESIQQHERPSPEPHATELMTKNGVRVLLGNLLTKDDFEDEDSLEESLGDIRTMIEGYGEIVNIEARREDCTAILTFSTLENATGAAKHFAGKVIGGQHIVARLLDTKLEDGGVEQTRRPSTTIALDNFLTEDDLEDEDNLEECLEDLRTMAEAVGTISDVQISKDYHGTVLIAYSDRTSAERALRHFSGRVIGGQIVSASMHNENVGVEVQDDAASWIVLTNVLTEEDLDDKDCLEETKDDIAELAGRYGQVLSVIVDTDIGGGRIRIEYGGSQSVASVAASKLDGVTVGGQKILATVLSTNDTEKESMKHEPIPTPITTAKQHGTGSDNKDAPHPQLFSGDKLISERFAECKRAPKISNVAPGPRHYAAFVDDERVKPLLIEMLGELMRLQNRAIEDKNAKARRRIVMGLREVARGIRSHKVKMVVMANNLDHYGAIDEKLQGILDLASQEDVPVFFEFSKRLLGKAVGKNIKVAVVGIQNADGAHQQFKKLLQIKSKSGYGA